MDMTGEAIVLLLKKNKRVVIPGVGAFIRKDGDGRVVFVEFLRKDDGVLTGELGRLYGLSQTEGRLAVDKFADNMKARVETQGVFVIEGLGAMRADASGIYDLEYDPEMRQPKHTPQVQVQVQVQAPAAVQPAAKPATQPVARPAAPAPATATAAPAPQPAAQSARAEQAPAAAAARAASAASAQTAAPAKATAEPASSRWTPAPEAVAQGKRKRMDIVMVIALAVVAVAIAVMIYGQLTGREQRVELNAAPAQTEQTEPAK